MDERVTKPTIETVLERMDAMEERISQRMDATNLRMDAMEERLSQRIDKLEQRLDSRLDRIESVASGTRSEMLELRADFRDWRVQLREHIPTLP
jgi:predicted  nucleic acid-binding Zn-ribbon protein